MKLTMEDILLMNALEKITGVSAKDCLVDGQLVSFFVHDKDMGKAIGKKAVNIKELEERLNKRIELVPYNEKPEMVFAKALEINFSNVKTNNGRVVVTLDQINKAKAYKNNARIKRVRELIQRNFGLELVIG